MAANDDDRELRIDALIAFQREKLAKLLRHRADITAQLRREELRAARAADALSAARALVAARAVGATLHADCPQSHSGGKVDGGVVVDCNIFRKVIPSVEHTVVACSDSEKISGSAPGVVDECNEDSVRTATVGSGNVVQSSETGFATPVGVLYSAFQKRFEAPRQSFVGCHGRATLVLPDNAALSDVSVGNQLVLVYWLDRNADHWREFVRPPRRAKCAGRIGVFATRSPNRPTPVGLSHCVVDKVCDQGRIVLISGVDVLDETPVLSVRRYDPSVDSFPTATAGWLEDTDVVQPLYYDEVEQELEVVITDNAMRKLAFIDQRSVVDVQDMVCRSLARGVRTSTSGMMPIGAFRVVYEPTDTVVKVVDVLSGMRDVVCEAEASVDPEALLHQQFKKEF